MKQTIEELNYNSWTIQKYIQVLKEEDIEVLNGVIKSSFSSIHETLWHMLWVEEAWFQRWQGNVAQKPESNAIIPELNEIEERFNAIHNKQIKFLESLTGSPEEVTISYTNFQGTPCEYSLGQLIRHLIYHSVYHRGQLATMLRQSGKVPPRTDYLVYLDEKKK